MVNNKLNVESFKNLFVLREDTYAKQDIGARSYARVNEKITDEVIKDHLAGTSTIGLYQVLNGKIKWACIDIDLIKEVWSSTEFKYNLWENKLKLQAAEWKQVLKDNGMSSYLEDSGNKGMHIWIFFKKSIPADPVKTALQALSTKVNKIDKNISWEIFPKQSTAEYGNCVKGPEGFHQASKRFSRFIDNLNKIKFVNFSTIQKCISPFDAIFDGCTALNKMVTEGLNNRHLTNDERLQLAFIFGNLDTDGKNYIKDKVFMHLSDWDERITDKNLNRIKEKQYKPTLCSSLQDDKLNTSTGLPICAEQCKLIKNSKSPIAFYYRAMGQSSDNNTTKNDNADYFNPLDNYFRKNNAYYYENYNKKEDKTTIIKLSNFAVDFTRDIIIDDGITKDRLIRGIITVDETNDKIPIEMKAECWGDSFQVKKSLHKAASVGLLKYDSMNLGKIINCIGKQDVPYREVLSKELGFRKLNGELVYATPSVLISKSKIIRNDEILIDLSDEDIICNLDMKILAEDRVKKLKKHIITDMISLVPKEIGLLCLSYTFLPIIDKFIPDGNKFLFMLRGQSGAGKSFLFKLLQRFYGEFISSEGDGDPMASWTGTPMSMERLGYFFNNTLMLIDDFKRSTIGTAKQYNDALRFMQNITDRAGRTRLRPDATMNKTYYVRGWPVITGEDKVEKESSNLARMITIELPETSNRFDLADNCEKECFDYCGVTPYFIQYMLNQDVEKIRNIFYENRIKFESIIKGKSNAARISINFAKLATSFIYVNNFFWPTRELSENKKMLYNYMEQSINTNLEAIIEEKASVVFWSTVNEMLAISEIKLQRSARREIAEIQERGVPVGYFMKDGKHCILIWNIVFSEVEKYLRRAGTELTHSKQAILDDLYHNGYSENKQAEPRPFNGSRLRGIKVKIKHIIDED